MKCGREIPAGKVFCEECLAEMEKYPVKPGTVVAIPRQPRQTVKRPNEHRTVTVEQRLEIMTKRVRALSFILTLTVALLIGAGALVVSLLQEGEEAPLPGQNYSIVDSIIGQTDASDEDVSRETSENTN